MEERKSQRKYPRIPLSMEVRCRDHAKFLMLVSKDISEGGIFVESSHIFPIGAELEMQGKLPYAHGELKIQGTVVRHHQEPNSGTIDGMAIEFKSLSEKERKMICNYIEHTILRKKDHKSPN